MTKHYVGESGTLLLLDTGILVGSVTDKHIKYKKPGGTTGTFTASVYSSFSQLAQEIGTYFLSHTLIPMDLDTPGDWRFHAWVAAVDGTWMGELVKATIYDTYQ